MFHPASGFEHVILDSPALKVEADDVGRLLRQPARWSAGTGILTLGRSLTPCRDTGFALGAVPVTGDGPQLARRFCRAGLLPAGLLRQSLDLNQAAGHDGEQPSLLQHPVMLGAQIDAGQARVEQLEDVGFPTEMTRVLPPGWQRLEPLELRRVSCDRGFTGPSTPSGRSVTARVACRPRSGSHLQAGRSSGPCRKNRLLATDAPDAALTVRRKNVRRRDLRGRPSGKTH